MVLVLSTARFDRLAAAMPEKAFDGSYSTPSSVNGRSPEVKPSFIAVAAGQQPAEHDVRGGLAQFLLERGANAFHQAKSSLGRTSTSFTSAAPPMPYSSMETGSRSVSKRTGT